MFVDDRWGNMGIWASNTYVRKASSTILRVLRILNRPVSLRFIVASVSWRMMELGDREKKRE